ncbi:tyrosine-protein kinase Fer-like protein, partial [Dinothrombium tinctorium]
MSEENLERLAVVQERHSEDLQLLVETFRKRNAELRKDRFSYQSALFTVWELLLQEVEVDSQVHGDIARSLNRKLGTVLLEKTFHRKIQSRKVFLHRESLEAILSKAEELLLKCQKDYLNAYEKVIASDGQDHLQEYYESHNNYVQQLHASNGMLKQYQSEILPSLLEELKEVYIGISDIITNSVEETTDLIANKVREQGNHYQTISNACKSVNASVDLASFIKALNPEKAPSGWRLHTFASPALMNETSIVPSATMDSMHNASLMLQNEIVIDSRNARLSYTKKAETFRQEMHTLEVKRQQLEEALDSLLKLQQRSLNTNLMNKTNELQEEISSKRFDLYVTGIHLAAVKSQNDLYLSKQREISGENGLGLQRERKSSTGSTVSIKMKWLKAFKSLNIKGATPNYD